MKDIITMAKDQKRSLNPRWSRTHWIAAHNRFSRAATLSKLADENITYDLAVYRDKLPDRWPGYLVPTSRKLGAEGLRQEHCVAAYHNRILNKSCAIACVFIDKVRWTVELSVFEDTIRIHQIRAKHNRAASPEIRSAIYKLLEIEEPKAKLLTSILPNSSENRKKELMLLNLQRIVPILREKGVVSVAASFYGGGDTGSIDSARVTMNTGDSSAAKILDSPGDTFALRTINSVRTGSDWTFTETEEVMPLSQALDEIVDNQVSKAGVDWYNNDGGYGEWSFDVVNETYSLSIDVNYTESTNEYDVTDVSIFEVD